ncbi:MAG: tetratricopeptide repeat protein, partial [Bacteroidales bacterium]|nr:tetratricopeptide repeat protein [Bacteroidales bacterium]
MKENEIEILGNGNIVIQDANAKNIIIKQNDPQLSEKLQKLNDNQISRLQQIVKKQADSFSELLKTSLNKIVSSKNIVQNSIIIADSVKIGDEINYYAEKQLDKYIGIDPVNAEVFIGRDNSTEEIHASLIKNESLLLLVNGEGGIGKTTLVSKYYHKYTNFYKYLIWIVAENGIKNALNSLAIQLNISFDNNSNQNQQIDIIIGILKNLPEPVLLIIDNANNSDDLTNNYTILERLSNLHILITSRIKDFPPIKNYKVNHLTEEFAIKLFKEHYSAFDEAETELLKNILEAINYNTLLIELLAKNTSKFNSELETDYSLASLLTDIQKKGLLKLSKTEKINTNYKYAHTKLSHAKPEEIVKAMFDIAELAPEQKQILSLLSVLPNVPIFYHELKLFLPQIKNIDIKLIKLANEAWCDYDKNNKTFKCNQLIAEVTREKNRENIKADISDLVSTLVEKLEYDASTGNVAGNFEQNSRYINYAENITRFNEFIASDYYLIYERIGSFYQTYGNLDKALKYFQERSRLGKELYESQPQNVGFKNGLAISYSKLGQTHTALGNLDKALKYFQEETELFEELYESQP